MTATWEQAEHITFTKHETTDFLPRVTVDRWPEVIAVEQRFLDAAIMHVRREADEIWFAVANGSATYRIEKHDAVRDRYLCKRIHHVWTPA